MISFRYQDKGTVIHKLNPFCKLAWVVSVFVLALSFNNPLFLICLFISTFSIIMVASLCKEWLSFMKLALSLCLAIILINALVSYNGTHILATAPFSIPVMGTPIITLEAIFYGMAMSVRLLIILSASFVLTLTINPDDLMQAMIKMRLPYKSVLVTALSTRFVPTLIDDVERIYDVQRSRGLELDKGGLRRRIKGRMSVIIPLLSNSLDRTVQVAEAMESRAFGNGTKRTFYKETTLNRTDIAILVCMLLPFALVIFTLFSGYGNYQYYPSLEGIVSNIQELSLLFILALFPALLVPFALLKRRFDLD